MAGFRHALGLTLALALVVGAAWCWNAYPDLVRLEPLRPWRGELMTWRIPILAIAAFLFLSLLQWVASKLVKPPTES